MCTSIVCFIYFIYAHTYILHAHTYTEVCVHMCVYTYIYIYIYAKLLQACPTFHNSMDCSLPGSSVHGIFQARILEQIAMPSPPGDLPHPGIEHTFLMSPALAGRFFTTSDSWQAPYIYTHTCFSL